MDRSFGRVMELCNAVYNVIGFIIKPNANAFYFKRLGRGFAYPFEISFKVQIIHLGEP